MEDGDHLIMGVLGLDQCPDHVPLLVSFQDPEDTAQDPILLFPDVVVTILFPQEGMLNTLGHQEIIHQSEMVTTFAAHTLQVMMMLLTKIIIQAMDISRNLRMSLMKHEIVGGRLLPDEFQDHCLGPDLDLLMCHPGTADNKNASRAVLAFGTFIACVLCARSQKFSILFNHKCSTFNF